MKSSEPLKALVDISDGLELILFNWGRLYEAAWIAYPADKSSKYNSAIEQRNLNFIRQIALFGRWFVVQQIKLKFGC